MLFLLPEKCYNLASFYRAVCVIIHMQALCQKKKKVSSKVKRAVNKKIEQGRSDDIQEKEMTTEDVQYVVDEKGDRTAVIVPIGEYEELIEDLHDLAIIAERREEPTVSLDELRKKLIKDGLL